MSEGPFKKINNGVIVERFGDLFKSTFISRPNRFIVNVMQDGNIIKAHLHDP